MGPGAGLPLWAGAIRRGVTSTMHTRSRCPEMAAISSFGSRLWRRKPPRALEKPASERFLKRRSGTTPLRVLAIDLIARYPCYHASR
jgi:hypothetical protein